jgi:hypothetical protein
MRQSHYPNLTHSVVPEPEGSSLCSQEPATGPYSEPTGSTLHSPAYLSNIHSDPILPSTLRSSEWSLSFRLSNQNLVHLSFLSHACHMPHPSHSPWIDLSNDIWGWVQIMKLLTVQLHFHVTSSLVGPNIILWTLFLNILSPRASLNVTDQVLHPYKLAEYILTFTSPDRRREGKGPWTEW